MATEQALAGRLARWIAAAEPDWDVLYAEELPRVYNFFRYRVGPGADAEDLTSRTFERAWRARYQYRQDLAGFSTWLFTIARHVAVDHLRARRPLVPIDEASDIAGGASPEDAASHRSDMERLSALLSGMGDREREILSLKYGAGLTNRAIARATGLSESNVGTILHRTVQAIRARW